MESITFTPRQARKYRDFSQGYVSQQLNVHVNTYCNLERHPELFTVEQSKKFAAIVMLPYDWISFCSLNLLKVDKQEVE